MGRLEVTHEKEGFVGVPLLVDPLERFVADYIARVAFVGDASVVVVLPGLALLFQEGVEVEALSGEYFVVVESDRFGMEVPLADNGGFVSCFLKFDSEVGLVVAVPVIVERPFSAGSTAIKMG